MTNGMNAEQLSKTHALPFLKIQKIQLMPASHPQFHQIKMPASMLSLLKVL